MATISNTLIEYLWQQTWQVAVLALIVGGLCTLLRHKSPHLRYMLWLVVLVKALVPPVFTIPLPILRPNPVDTASNLIRPMDGAPKLDGPLTQTTTVTYPDLHVPGDPGVRVHEILTWIWLAGVAALGCLSMARAAVLRRRLSRNRLQLPEDQARSIEGLMASLGLAHRPRIWLVRDASQPFVWGLGRGHVHIPAHFMDQVSPTDLRMVLAHEFCHCLRYDALVNMIQVLAQTVFWFHPLVWWANVRIRTEREKCCDEMAIALLGTPARAYGSAIVNALATEQGPGMAIPSLAIAGSLKGLEERIGDLMRHSTFRTRPSLLATTGVLLLTLIVVPSSVVLSRQQALTSQPSSEPMIPQRDPNVGPKASEPNQEMMRIRVDRMSRLKHIGEAISLFAIDHDETLPGSLRDIQPYCDPNLYQWAQTNVEYVGKGTLDRTSTAPIAFDQEYLWDSKGTMVLFAHGAVAYVSRPMLEDMGIIDPKIHFLIKTWIAMVPEDDLILTQFLEEQVPQIDIAASRLFTDQQVEAFRELAKSIPGSRAPMAQTQLIVLGGQTGRISTVSREVFKVDPNASPDPCRPVLAAFEFGIKMGFLCTQHSDGLIRVKMTSSITDEIPAGPGELVGTASSDLVSIVTLPPSLWVLFRQDLLGQHYYLWCQVTPLALPRDRVAQLILKVD